jgi:hypothetical protein
LPIAGSAGVTWQTCFDKDGWTFLGGSSPLLKLFREKLDDGAVGVMIRFHTYRTLYFQNGSKFDCPGAKNLCSTATGICAVKNFSNPAYSVLVGTIGSGHAASRERAERGFESWDSTQADALIGADGQRRCNLWRRRSGLRSSSWTRRDSAIARPRRPILRGAQT